MDANTKWVTKDELDRLGVPRDFTDPYLLVFKMVSDNGANMKADWNDGSRWVPCVDHTLELCTLPVTWVQKHQGESAAVPKGSVAEAYAHGRGIVGYLHVSVNAQHDFHQCQKRQKLPQTMVDLDVKTRWRTAHNMGEQLVFNKPAITEMDKNLAYKDAGETWGKHKITMLQWNYLEEGTAILNPAADASQFLEADLYPTSSLVVPMTYRLMETSAINCDIKFPNRAGDQFNDPSVNPVKVSHGDLTMKIQEARVAFHAKLIDKFHTDVPRDVKQFWFIASLLDPRFKKLTFKHDGMLSDSMRVRAIKWLTAEFNLNYKGKVVEKQAAAEAGGAAVDPAVDQSAAFPPHLKRRKTSAASFFADSSEEDSGDDAHGAAGLAAEEELEAYLELPQIKYTTEQSMLDWWKTNTATFPNIAVMARQYLGCPASSAAVERLFSQVGIAFSAKRKKSGADTLESIMFTHANLP